MVRLTLLPILKGVTETSTDCMLKILLFEHMSQHAAPYHITQVFMYRCLRSIFVCCFEPRPQLSHLILEVVSLRGDAGQLALEGANLLHRVSDDLNFNSKYLYRDQQNNFS